MATDDIKMAHQKVTDIENILTHQVLTKISEIINTTQETITPTQNSLSLPHSSPILLTYNKDIF